MSESARNRKGLRKGYTTGSNAAAAAKAATLALLTGFWPTEVTISLPNGEKTTMKPVECQLDANRAYCCMIKDAGDDPDITNGALICAEVRRLAQPGILLQGGEGVGKVTLPGLGLQVGEAAINPVPRQQILTNVANALAEIYPENPSFLQSHGLKIEIIVPEGAKLAQKTLNPRLGIIGGISILGTTGRVFPYSTAAWQASVVQAVGMAAYNKVQRVVLATGGRSERFGMQLFPELPRVAFVEMSTFTGPALKACIKQQIPSAILVGMIAKIVKTAQGHMVTPVTDNQVDFAFLAQICRQVNAPNELTDAVATANTARHFLELCQERNFLLPLQKIVEIAHQQCQKFIQKQKGSMALEVILVDFDGKVLAWQK